MNKNNERVVANRQTQSNQPIPDDNNQRLLEDIADLQSTVAYLELTVDSLNAVVTKQDQLLQDMQRQLQLMFARLPAEGEDSITPFDAVSEVPPHY